jgi:hypothetical protein
MTDSAVTQKSNTFVEIFLVIAMSFSAGVFLISGVSYFARGETPQMSMDAAVVIVNLAVAFFMARRILRKIP